MLKHDTVAAVLAPALLALAGLLSCSSAPTEAPVSGPAETHAVTADGLYPDFRDNPPEEWGRKPVFRLRADYPPTPGEPYPWERFHFEKQWREYLISVRDYCYEGNIEVDWVVQKNTKRAWYHTPWLHWGRNGREFVHGMTHERVSEPEELARTQTSRFQNWAISIYNAPGGYTIGQVWRDPSKPNPEAAKFPPGTVACKLLFTQADTKSVPYLEGSIEWEAHIYRETAIPTNPQMERVVQKVRLLQLDVAVRDPRADKQSGWVFGTFVYNKEAQGKTPWEKMVPIGLMWGNDEGVTSAQVRAGQTLKETIINQSEEVPHQHLGWAGRLNGPVDNPISSCLACHATAQWPVAGRLVNPVTIVPRRTIKQDSPEWMKWFKNVKSGEPFSKDDRNMRSLDYSLQLQVGIQNFYEWQTMLKTRGGATPTPTPTPFPPSGPSATPPGGEERKASPPASREAVPDRLADSPTSD